MELVKVKTRCNKKRRDFYQKRIAEISFTALFRGGGAGRI